MFAYSCRSSMYIASPVAVQECPEPAQRLQPGLSIITTLRRRRAGDALNPSYSQVCTPSRTAHAGHVTYPYTGRHQMTRQKHSVKYYSVCYSAFSNFKCQSFSNFERLKFSLALLHLVDSKTNDIWLIYRSMYRYVILISIYVSICNFHIDT